MTKKYEIELFEGDWGILIGRYDTIEEAEEEYESWNNSKKLYEERKDRLYDKTEGWYYKPWTSRGAYRIQKTRSIMVTLNEKTYDKNNKIIYDEYDEPAKIIKSIYYSGSDFLEDYNKENETDDED